MSRGKITHWEFEFYLDFSEPKTKKVLIHFTKYNIRKCQNKIL